MQRRLLVVMVTTLVLVPACTPARTPPELAPPAPTRSPAATAGREPPPNWQLLDAAADGVPGISLLRAERELLAGRAPRRTVVVAVIDVGIDTAHPALRASLWTNPKELPGNGRDDDGNGYADDLHGWDFVGGRDGRSIRYDTFEVTRLYARCTHRAAGAAAPEAADAPIGDDGATCARVVADFRRQRAETEQRLAQFRATADTLRTALALLREAIGADSVTAERVAALDPARSDVQTAKQWFLDFAARNMTPARLDRLQVVLQTRLQYWFNPAFDPRGIVGDNYADPTERHYGNADVVGPDPSHGTAVSGVVAATRGGAGAPAGVAPAVRVMMVRAGADGDERDKDVANAIRYAADNGAHVISMSFGKEYSPHKRVVDDAVRHADARGVLMVHAAGNNAADVGVTPHFPTRHYVGGGEARHWIEVGASSWKGGDSLAAPFSNYGHTRVDVFAPGVDIVAAVPGGGSRRDSGTSLAAPIVAGLAALIMAYYPELTTADVRHIILASATRRGEQLVVRPGSRSGERVPFGSLSATGSIVNAYAAIRLAEEMTTGKR
ncbi:MAG: S8 family serine peptidase [Gemmatimonadaceae bacterium]